MATVGLYGSSSSGVVAAATGSDTTGLYGNTTQFGGTYFEWFIFQESATQPATPTGGSWSFTTNTGTPPTGWSATPPSSPANQVWVSIAIVNSKTSTALTWSAPGLFSYSAGLPVLSGAGVPDAGLGQNSQLYVQTSTSPQSIWFKESGAWVQLTGQVVAIVNGGTGATTASGARANLGAAASGANSDITSLSGITGGISTADYLQLDIAITPTTAVGKLQWDPTWNGPQIGMGGGNVNLQIGQETLIYVYNNTGSTLTDGQVVYVTGSQGQRVTVALAQANSDSTSAAIIGMVTESIANNTSGFVTTQGMVNAIDTRGAADGAVIWLSPTTAGAWTTTKPQAPQHLVMVGYVVKGGSAGAGSVYIHPQNGYEIDELHDVKITSRAAYNLLQVDPTNSYWQNVAGPTSAVVGVDDAQTLTNKTFGDYATTFQGSLSVGTEKASLDASIELGNNRTASGNAYIDLHSSSGTDYDARIIKEPGANGNFSIVNNSTSGAFIFQSNQSEAARFDGSNNFGIGTVPTGYYKFEVGTNSTGTGSIFRTSSGAVQIVATDGTVSQFVGYAYGSVAYAGTQSNHPYVFAVNNAERGRFDTAGNFGIGTTSPAFKADIVGQTRSTSFVETKTAIAASAIDLTAGNYFTKTISGTTTFTVSGTPSTGNVASFVLDLTNGGSASVTWWSGVKWASGTAPTLTTSGRDVLGFFTHDGGTTWNGFVLGKAMA